MRRIASTVLAASILSVGLLGCDQPPSKAGGSGVAIVDFQKVVERSGKGAMFNTKLMQVRQAIGAEIQKNVQVQEAAVKKADADAKAASSPDADKKLADAKAELQKAISDEAVKLGAPQLMQEAQMRIVNEFRVEVAKVAMAVALEKGMSVVLNADAAMNFTTDADITEAVITELAKAPAATGSVGGFGGGGFGGPPGGGAGPGVPPAPVGPGGGVGPSAPSSGIPGFVPSGSAGSSTAPGTVAPAAPTTAPATP